MTDETTTSYDLCRASFLELFKNLRNCKPNDRSEIDRVYAVTLTEVEKAFGYFHYFAQPAPTE